jgi:phosphoglycolate phosphatase-like HAD superfamily hydrolase
MNHLVTFDIDNTLIKNSAGHAQVLTAAIKAIYNLDTGITDIRHHGMTDQEIIIKILAKYQTDPDSVPAGLRQCMDHMQQQYAAIAQAENIRLLDGVGELLNKLEQNSFLLGLVTGNLEKIAWAKMERIGLRHFFKFGGFGSDHIRRAELVKIAVQRAKKQFGFNAGRPVFHVGDAPQDMQAGREAGVIPIGVATGIFSADELDAAGAGKVFPDLKNTDDILRFMLSV